MSAITEFLYPTPAKRTVGGIVKWWEKRRLGYNVAVGASGLFSLGASTLLRMLPPAGDFEMIPWQVVVVFGLAANICYLFGPTVEVLVDKLWGRQVLPVGPALYRMGLTFSIGLTLMPTLLMLFYWVVRIVIAIF